MDFKEAEDLIRPMLEPYEIDEVELQKSALLLSCGIDRTNPKPLHTRTVERLVRRASQDVLAFDVAKILAIDGLRSGWPLPPQLTEFIACLLDGSAKRPVKRGPKREVLRLRNQSICAAIEVLRNRGVTLEEAFGHLADSTGMSSENISDLWKGRGRDLDATRA